VERYCDSSRGYYRHEILVDGKAVVLGLSHKAFVKFRERTGRDLTDREASFIAAEFFANGWKRKTSVCSMTFTSRTCLRLIDQIGIK